MINNCPIYKQFGFQTFSVIRTKNLVFRFRRMFNQKVSEIQTKILTDPNFLETYDIQTLFWIPDTVCVWKLNTQKLGFKTSLYLRCLDFKNLLSCLFWSFPFHFSCATNKNATLLKWFPQVFFPSLIKVQIY